MTEELIQQIWELRDGGMYPSRIAQKLKLTTASVKEVLGNANKKGAGDIVESITEATGIKAAVESLTDDCGCAARKEALNDLFPNRKLNDLSIDDFDFLTGLFASDVRSVDSNTQKILVDIYNRVFNAKRVVSNCSPCVATIVRELKTIYLRAAKK